MGKPRSCGRQDRDLIISFVEFMDFRKNICKFVFGAIVFAGFFSCAKQEMPVSGDSMDLIRISAKISDDNLPGVKAEIGENGSGSFEVNDKISLYVTPEGMTSCFEKELILASGGWYPRMKWSDFNTEKAVFTAYFPAISGKGEYVHSIAANQGSAESFAASDLLSASIEASKGSPVDLVFSHLMNKLTVTLHSSGEVTSEELASAKVRINSQGSVVVNLADGTLKPAGDKEIKVIPMRSGNVFRAVLCPQDIKKEWKEDSWIEIEIKGVVYKFKAPSSLDGGAEPFDKLISGKEVKINITIDRKPSSPEPGDWAGKTVWVKGLSNIPDPAGWKFIYQVPDKRYGLKWDSSYGWYDSNKRYPNGKQDGPVVDEAGSGLDDKNLCWAATASNMIYWWLDANKDNISKFGYRGPKTYNDSFSAEILEFFRKNFKNVGYDVNSILNWFFTGRSSELYGDKGAFFKDVLGENEIASKLYACDGGRFTTVIKEALSSGCVIGCNHTFPNKTLHSINIWGASFDQNGEITHIYVTDSNDGDLMGTFETEKMTRAGLVKRAVKVIAGDTCMESSAPGKFSLPIVNVYTIDSMNEKWAEYFSK